MGNQLCFKQFQEKRQQFVKKQLKIINNAPKSNYASRVESFPNLSEGMEKIKKKFQISEIEQCVQSCPVYYIYQKQAFYQGQWKIGLPHGYGKILYSDKSYYSGFIIDGQPNTGQSKQEEALYIFSNEDYYVGQFKNCLFNGKGKLVAQNGTFSYVGQFLNGVPHGKGFQNHLTIKQSYEGNYVDGIKFGKGKYYINGIMVYEGQFKQGNFDGEGRLIDYDGSQFVGTFKSGKKIQGQYIASGVTYQGDFTNGKINGNGIYEWEDGKVFSGNFKDGRFDGVGKIYHPNGKIIEGKWYNGRSIQITKVQQKTVEQIAQTVKVMRNKFRNNQPKKRMVSEQGWQSNEKLVLKG